MRLVLNHKRVSFRTNLCFVISLSSSTRLWSFPTSTRWPFLKSVLSDAKGAACCVSQNASKFCTPNHNLCGHSSLLGNLVRPARVKRTTSIYISSDSGCYIHSHILKKIYKDVKNHKTRHKSQQSIRYWG